MAYQKQPAGFLSEVLPLKYKTSSKLLFYQNGQTISYNTIRDIIGTAIPIVSHICLNACFTYFGKAISPDCDELIRERGEKIGSKGFITLKSNRMYS
jgi:hypothetical protein